MQDNILTLSWEVGRTIISIRMPSDVLLQQRNWADVPLSLAEKNEGGNGAILVRTQDGSKHPSQPLFIYHMMSPLKIDEEHDK